MDEDEREERRDKLHKSKRAKKDRFRTLFPELNARLKTHGYLLKGDKSRRWKHTTALSKKKKGKVSLGGSREKPSWVPSFKTYEDFNQMMMQLLDGFMIVLNTDGVIIFVAQNVSSILGLFPSDIAGKKLLSLLPDEEQYTVHQKITIKSPLSASVGKHITFCCHVKRGDFGDDGSPDYEYVRFIMSVKDITKEPFALFAGVFSGYLCPDSSMNRLWENQFCIVGSICVLRVQTLQDYFTAKESNIEVIMIQDSDEEYVSEDNRSVQDQRRSSRMESLHAEPAAAALEVCQAAALEDQIDNVLAEQYGSPEAVGVTGTESYYIPCDSSTFPMESMSPGTSSLQSFKFDLELDLESQMDSENLEFPVHLVQQDVVDLDNSIDLEDLLDRKNWVDPDDLVCVVDWEVPLDQEILPDQEDQVVEEGPVDWEDPVVEEGPVDREDLVGDEGLVDWEDLVGDKGLVDWEDLVGDEGLVDWEDLVGDEGLVHQEGLVDWEDLVGDEGLVHQEGLVDWEDLVGDEDLVHQEGLVDWEDLVGDEGLVHQEGLVDWEDLVGDEGLVNQEGLVDWEDLVGDEGLVHQEGLVDWEDLVGNEGLVDWEDLVGNEGLLHQEGLVDWEDLVGDEGLVHQEGPVDWKDLVGDEGLLHQEGPVDWKDPADWEDPINQKDPMDEEGPIDQENIISSSMSPDTSAQPSQSSSSTASYTNSHEPELLKKFMEQLEEMTQVLQADVGNQQDALEMMKEQIQKMQDSRVQQVQAPQGHIGPENFQASTAYQPEPTQYFVPEEHPDVEQQQKQLQFHSQP